MIRRDNILAILQKELLDTVRDKKTMIINIALPVVLWPTMAMIMTQFANSQFVKQQQTVSRVAFVGQPTARIAEAVSTAERIDVVDLRAEHRQKIISLLTPLPTDMDTANTETGSASTTRAVEAVIEADDIDAIIVVRTLQAKLNHPANVRMNILYDSTNETSEQAAERIRTILSELRDELVRERLADHGFDISFLQPLKLSFRNIATTTKTTQDVAGKMLPLLLIVLIVLGGFYPAITMTAGEKEHGTLPTLLCTPISHLELLLGKYFAILAIALAGVFANIASICAVLVFGLGDVGTTLSPTIVGCIAVALVPTAMLYTALFMAVAIFANSFREGQNLLSPITMVAVLPAYSAFLPGVEMTMVTAVTPGFNIALLIKEAMVRPIDSEFVILTLLSNLAWTLTILVFTARVFQAEQVLLSGRFTIGDVFTLDRQAMPEPLPQLSTLLFLAYLSGTFYLSGILLQYGISILIPVLQLGLFAMVPIFIARYFHMPVATVFRLRRPSPLAMVGAILVGCTLVAVNAWLSQLFPPPNDYVALTADKLRLTDDTMPLVLLLLLIAVLPGICEELAFRGIMLSGYLSRLTPLSAISLTALWFAFAHFSIYRLLPLLVMGAVLAYVAWRTGSLWPGVTIHILNNGLVAILSRFEATLGINDKTLATPGTVIIAIIVSGIGLVMIHRSAHHTALSETNVPRSSGGHESVG